MQGWGSVQIAAMFGAGTALWVLAAMIMGVLRDRTPAFWQVAAFLILVLELIILAEMAHGSLLG